MPIFALFPLALGHFFLLLQTFNSLVLADVRLKSKPNLVSPLNSFFTLFCPTSMLLFVQFPKFQSLFVYLMDTRLFFAQFDP